MDLQISRKDEYYLYKEAQDHLIKENHFYQSNIKKNKGLDFAWVHSISSKGTFSDKISANTLLVQDSPKNNLKCLEFLVDLVNPKSKRESLLAMNSLKDLFLANLLKKEKLRKFSDLVINIENYDKDERKKILVNAFYEDKLKQLYFKFIQNVEHYTHDPDFKTKKISIKILFDLLVNNCEQEQYLLENLVNKLGDPDAKITSLVVFFLGKLTNEHHPAMKEVIIKEVERVLYRKNISTKTQYNSLCFFSSIIFLRSEVEAANKVMTIYLDFFKLCLKKQLFNSKFMAILLTGISRAFPFSALENNYLEDNIDTIYKIIHFINFNIAIQAYNLIFQIITKERSGFLTDRFCISLYKSLFNPNIESCSKKASYLNLLYKCIKNDCLPERNLAFIKRILQVSFQSSSNLTCAFLLMISSILKEKKDLNNKFYNTFNKVHEMNPSLYDEDEEEDFKDVDLEDEYTNEQKKNLLENKKNVKSSWVFAKINSIKNNQINYQALHRNPIYASAEQSRPFEICLLRNHYHPTISLFIDNLFNKIQLEYDGDALYDFNLKSFLDKFVYKNPKKISKLENNNAREKSLFERNLNYNSSKIAINTPSFISQTEDKIPIEERFIYTFLKNKKKYQVDDNESVSSEDFEKFVLKKFESNFDQDFTNSIFNKKKKKRDDSTSDLNSEEDIEFDFDNDEEYDEAFKEFENEINLKTNGISSKKEKMENKDSLSSEIDDEEDDTTDDEKTYKKNKTSFKKTCNDNDLMSLLASADEFAHLLEENEDLDLNYQEYDDEYCDNKDEDDDLNFDDDEENIKNRKNRRLKRKSKDEKACKIFEKIQKGKLNKKAKLSKEQKVIKKDRNAFSKKKKFNK